jgi:cyanophycin synthetase
VRNSPTVSFNVLGFQGAAVIVDFGHNPSALESIVESMCAFNGRRRTVVLSADGDRRDDVVTRQAEILAPHFDRVVLYEEPARNRGRAPGEISILLRRGLASAPRGPEIVEVLGEQAAITYALNGVEDGNVLLVLVDAVDTSLALVQRLVLDGIRAKSSEGDRSPSGGNGS